MIPPLTEIEGVTPRKVSAIEAEALAHPPIGMRDELSLHLMVKEIERRHGTDARMKSGHDDSGKAEA